MPRSRRHPIVGAAWLEESLSSAILPELQKIRPAIVPVPVRAAALGHLLCATGRRRRPWWPAFRPRRPLYSRALRRMAVLLDHPSRSNRYADHRDCTAERRSSLHRGQLPRYYLQFAVSHCMLFLFAFQRSTVIKGVARVSVSFSTRITLFLKPFTASNFPGLLENNLDRYVFTRLPGFYFTFVRGK